MYSHHVTHIYIYTYTNHILCCRVSKNGNGNVCLFEAQIKWTPGVKIWIIPTSFYGYPDPALQQM